MKIQKLTLEGFRGFKDKTEFELHPNVNVFVGVNGSGKTSVLDAASLLIGAILNQLYGGELVKFTKDELSIGKRYGLLDIIILNQNKQKTQFSRTISLPEHPNEQQRIHGVSDGLGNLHNTINLILYYKTNRSSKADIYEKDTNIGFHITDFNSFKLWYVEEENEENRTRRRKQPNYQNPYLTPVRNALTSFFQKIGNDVYSNLYVEMERNGNSHLNAFKTVLLIEKNEIPFKLDSLSDGEKMLILMIGDIARRLTIVYDEIPPEEVLKQHGIVLIDEIETHLHPAWQRDIIPALTHVFPNVQFLFTTHSPQVLSNVRKECVHMIKDFKRVPFTPSIYGADSNMILWDIFGVKKRPKHADEKFREYYRALETKDRDAALKLLEGLQKHFGEDRLDVQKAKTAFEFEYDEYLPEV